MKLRLAQLLGKTGLAPALLAARRLGRSPWITVLGYHRAGPVGVATPYDDEVIDVTPEAFERQLVFLKRWCNVVDNAQMLAFAGGARLPPNPVHLTFDDGYLDNHDVVLPLLQRHGLTATFFVATSYVEDRRLFWWDRINFLVKTSRRELLELDYPRSTRLPLAPLPAQRAATIKVLTRVVKDHYGLDLERFLAHVAEAAEVNLSPEEERRRVDALLMTWEHVRALRRGGMDVQSHTSTHRVLQTLSPESLAHELEGSRKVLEGVLDEPVRSISYPVGKPIRTTPHIREAVRAAGYELGFSYCSGVNHARSFDPLDVRRVSTDSAESEADFRAMIAVPHLAT
jgi:peptidoglycan/xylan/chitin deacetylase (PgdA/CDA1 family)